MMMTTTVRWIGLLGLLQLSIAGIGESDAEAKKKPRLPEFDHLRSRWLPSAEKAWILTGNTDWPAKITATAITKEGRFLLIGDDDGYVGLLNLESQTIVWRRRIYSSGNAISLLSPDPTGGQFAVHAKTTTGAAVPYHLLNTASGRGMEFPLERSPSSACRSLDMATLDPIQFGWSPDGSTLFTLFISHMLANRDNCMVGAEQYLYLRNLNVGKVDIKLTVFDQFRKPEGDEPATVWCFAPNPQMAVSPDGKTVAVTSCNSRVTLYSIANNKIKLKAVSRALYRWLTRLGFDEANGNGAVIFNNGAIITALGGLGELATTLVVSLSSDLKKISVLARVGRPLPVLRASRNGRYLMVGRGTIDVWDLESRSSVFHGPRGSHSAHLSQFHGKKRALMLMSGTRVHYLVERPRISVALSKDWAKTGRMVFHRDSFFVKGKGKIGWGYGNWLRDDYRDDEVFVNDGLSDASQDDDINEEGEIQLRTQEPGEFVFYGGRTADEGKTVPKLIENLPTW